MLLLFCGLMGCSPARTADEGVDARRQGRALDSLSGRDMSSGASALALLIRSNHWKRLVARPDVAGSGDEEEEKSLTGGVDNRHQSGRLDQQMMLRHVESCHPKQWRELCEDRVR